MSTFPHRSLRKGKPYFSRALLLVMSGLLFWMVAVGPENTAIRGLADVSAMALIARHSPIAPTSTGVRKSRRRGAAAQCAEVDAQCSESRQCAKFIDFLFQGGVIFRGGVRARRPRQRATVCDRRAVRSGPHPT